MNREEWIDEIKTMALVLGCLAIIPTIIIVDAEVFDQAMIKKWCWEIAEPGTIAYWGCENLEDERMNQTGQ